MTIKNVISYVGEHYFLVLNFYLRKKVNYSFEMHFLIQQERLCQHCCAVNTRNKKKEIRKSESEISLDGGRI